MPKKSERLRGTCQYFRPQTMDDSQSAQGCYANKFPFWFFLGFFLWFPDSFISFFFTAYFLLNLQSRMFAFFQNQSQYSLFQIFIKTILHFHPKTVQKMLCPLWHLTFRWWFIRRSNSHLRIYNQSYIHTHTNMKSTIINVLIL